MTQVRSQHRKRPSQTLRVTIGVIATSIFLHLFTLYSLESISVANNSDTRSKVKIQVTEKAPPRIPDPAPEPPPKPKPKQKEKAPPTHSPKAQTKPQSQTPPTPVLGLSAESFGEGASGFVAPVGNTLMKEDTGERLRPEQIAKLDRDLSSDAKLDPETFVKPEYTAAAIDAGVEGRFFINFFVEKSGQVTSATLERKVGYDMDERLLNAARSARFHPRKDALGQPISGWARIAIDLILP